MNKISNISILGRWAACCCLLAFLSCSGGGGGELPPGALVNVGLDFKFVTNKTMSCDWLLAFTDADEALLSFLWKTPGQNYDCLIAWMGLPNKQKTLLIHLSNGVCRRKGNCPADEPTDDDIVNVAREVHEFVTGLCEDCELILVPQLEDNWTADEACYQADQIRSVSTAAVARNPVSGAGVGNSAHCFDIIELHNVEAAHFPAGKPCIYSNDGYDLRVGNSVWDLPHIIDREQLRAEFSEYSRCLRFVWTADGNCLAGDTKTAPLPAERKCSLERSTVTDLGNFIGEFYGQNS